MQIGVGNIGSGWPLVDEIQVEELKLFSKQVEFLLGPYHLRLCLILTQPNLLLPLASAKIFTEIFIC